MEAGVKPWVLADQMHYDLYIGIDVLHGRVGYNFLYGKGARNIKTVIGETIRRGRIFEAIKSPEIRKHIFEEVRLIARNGYDINNIVIHRDGRWWNSESRGLREAFQELKKEGLLPQNFCYSVVEIRKNHIPVRLFNFSKNQYPYFRNPLPGTYLVLDSKRVILTTTGGLGNWDEQGPGKTASTLMLVIKESNGDFNIIKIAEDAYRLTHLNWSAPDIEISLPVTIRWTDDALREKNIAQLQEDEDFLEGEEDEESENVVEEII